MKKAFYSGFFLKPFSFLLAAILGFGIISLLASCRITKNAYFFETLQKDSTLSGLVNKDLESKIIKGDNLGIIISSLNKDEDMMFNTGSGVSSINSSAIFPVDQDGNIMIHKLGLIKAAGNTRKELALLIQKNLAPFLKDPIVNVQYLNRKVTVMGEVERPQVINMLDEQLSVIDAIVICGDAKQYAKRDNILVIREEGNQKKVKVLNFKDASIFSSPWYYLQSNDIVYVVPDVVKRQTEEKRARFQTNFALAISSISLLIIILDRIIR